MHCIIRIPSLRVGSTACGVRLGRPCRWASGDAQVDVLRARQETKGCETGQIFLNSAGSSLPPRAVVKAHIDYLRDEELCGGYAVAEKSEHALEAFYPAAARLLNCNDNEVAFVESATRGWTLLLNSIRFSPGDRILTSASDYGSNFVGYIQARDRWGVEIEVVPDDDVGQIDLQRLKKVAAHPRSRLISINHVPTCGGLIQPVAEVGKIANEFGLLYLLDACQSVGQMEVNVDKIGCDMLTTTGRKFLRGPRGTGLMYVRSSALPRLEPQALDQEGAVLMSETQVCIRPDARCFEQYECNFGGKVGLAIAMEYALSVGLGAIEFRVRALADRLRRGLASFEQIQVTDIGQDLCAIVTFTVSGRDATTVKKELARRGVQASVSAAAGGAPRVWFDRRGLSAVVRLSPHYFNTEEEVDECIRIIGHICSSSLR